MKICLLVEGNYPYLVGGVSNWVHQLISNLPEHEFIIYSIAAQEKNRGKFVFDIPKNVIKIEEIFLDSILNLSGEHGKQYRLSDEEIKNFSALVLGGKVDWHSLITSLKNRKIGNVIDFFMSYDFFKIIKDAYKQEHGSTPFTEFFWTNRSLLIPFLFIINQKIIDADIYHSVVTGYAGIVGSLASFINNKPFILTEHGIYSREREEEIIKANWIEHYFKDNWIGFYYNLADLAYTMADEVITLFEKNKEIQISHGCSKNKIRIISNGIDVNAFSDIRTKNSDDNTLYIGAFVRVVPIKDIITMLQSFALVKTKVTKAKFYIMGDIEEDEEYYHECLRFVDDMGLKDVFFTGKIDIMDYLGMIDILVLTSISEGQPLTILEGMACKKPFVTTDVGSCKELLYGSDDRFGPAGFIEPLMDSEKISESIIRLCKDPILREKMGHNGFERVSKMYTFENFLNSYRLLYHKYSKREEIWLE